jgi:hypothetical protein
MASLLQRMKEFFLRADVPQSGPLRDAYQAGCAADPRASNPHAKGTAYYRMWEQGHADTAKEEHFW